MLIAIGGAPGRGASARAAHGRAQHAALVARPLERQGPPRSPVGAQQSAEVWMVTALIGVTTHSSSMRPCKNPGNALAGKDSCTETGYDRSWEASHERRIGTTCFACMACR